MRQNGAYDICHISRKMAGKTVYITGASRGIGEMIGLKCAKDGANVSFSLILSNFPKNQYLNFKVVIAAKTTEPHPKLPGTIYTAAQKSKILNANFKTTRTLRFPGLF